MSIERDAARRVADIEAAKRLVTRAISRVADGSMPCVKRCSGLIDAMFYLGHIDEAELEQYLGDAEKAASARRARLGTEANTRKVEQILSHRGAA